MKKMTKLGMVLGICMGIFLFSYMGKVKAENKKTIIGITQIVEHPALDATRKGIVDALKAGGYGEDKVEIIYKNSQGDFPTAQLIGQEFNNKVDVAVAISTPSAQAILNSIKTKPVFFSVVTYPEKAGILEKNVTGVSDRTPVNKQVKLIKELLPNAKRVGTIYNTSEKNAADTIEEFEKAVKDEGLVMVTKGITNVNEIASALDILLNDIDVLYTSTDNTIASSYPLIVEKCNSKKIPIIGATKDYIDQGALAADAISEYDVGYQTGEMIVKYLNGTKIEDIPYEVVTKSEKMVNKSVAAKLGITVK